MWSKTASRASMRWVLLLGIGPIASGGRLYAGQFVWTNQAGDQLWPTASNWTPAGPPGPLDDVVFGDAGVGTVYLPSDQQVGLILFQQGLAAEYVLGDATAPAHLLDTNSLRTAAGPVTVHATVRGPENKLSLGSDQGILSLDAVSTNTISIANGPSGHVDVGFLTTTNCQVTGGTLSLRDVAPTPTFTLDAAQLQLNYSSSGQIKVVFATDSTITATKPAASASIVNLAINSQSGHLDTPAGVAFYVHGLTGPGTLVKTGAGDLHLAGTFTNAYTGGFDLQDGLTMITSSPFPRIPVLVRAGATLQTQENAISLDVTVTGGTVISGSLPNSTITFGPGSIGNFGLFSLDHSTVTAETSTVTLSGGLSHGTLTATKGSSLDLSSLADSAFVQADASTVRIGSNIHGATVIATGGSTVYAGSGSLGYSNLTLQGSTLNLSGLVYTNYTTDFGGTVHAIDDTSIFLNYSPDKAVARIDTLDAHGAHITIAGLSSSTSFSSAATTISGDSEITSQLAVKLGTTDLQKPLTLSGTGDVTIVAKGSADLTLNSTGTLFFSSSTPAYTGTVRVVSGTVSLGDASLGYPQNRFVVDPGAAILSKTARDINASNVELHGGTLRLADPTDFIPSPIASAVIVTADSVISAEPPQSGSNATHRLGSLSIGDQTLLLLNHKDHVVTFEAVASVDGTGKANIVNNATATTLVSRLGTLRFSSLNLAATATLSGSGVTAISRAYGSGDLVVSMEPAGRVLITGDDPKPVGLDPWTGQVLVHSGTLEVHSWLPRPAIVKPSGTFVVDQNLTMEAMTNQGQVQVSPNTNLAIGAITNSGTISVGSGGRIASSAPVTWIGGQFIGPGTLDASGGLDVQASVSTTSRGLIRIGPAGLAIAPAAKLDIGNGGMILSYTGTTLESPVAQIQQWVSNWIHQVPGSAMLMTSQPEGAGFSRSGRTLAVFDNHDAHLASFMGTVFAAGDYNQVLVKYTYFGDANVDGRVDPTDYAIVDGNQGKGQTWVTGDLNFDGKVDPTDYAQIDGNQGAGYGGDAGPQLAQLSGEYVPLAVPEPCITHLLAVLTTAALGKRVRWRPTAARNG
jgi:autotransporter-associated beta strand protein